MYVCTSPQSIPQNNLAKNCSHFLLSFKWYYSGLHIPFQLLSIKMATKQNANAYVYSHYCYHIFMKAIYLATINYMLRFHTERGGGGGHRNS